MKFAIIGGDLRTVKLAEMLAKDENQIYLYGLEKAEDLKNNPKIIIKTPPKIPLKNVTETTDSASFLFPAPRLLEIKLPAPIPSIKPTAWIMVIMEKTIPTAALALVPNLETKNISESPYTDITSILRIVGTAIFSTTLGTGLSNINERFWILDSFLNVFFIILR